MYDQILHLDFETYYDRDYTLSKMPTINYVRDPRFQTLGVAVALGDEPSRYLSHEEFTAFAQSLDWPRTAVSAYNCLFDGTVLVERYGIRPCYYICPMSAARALLPLDRVPLKAVAALLQLGEKGDALAPGSHESTQALADYACNDNELARAVVNLLYPLLAPREADVINLTVRQGVEASLVLDLPVLEQVRDDAAQARDAAIAASGYSDKQLTSNPQFLKIIEGLGLTAPTKLSATTGEETEAFAKGDDEFVGFMLAHPEHKHVWEGRLAAKSNINQRRAEKFIAIAQSHPSHTTPMPLNYCGALTGRASGSDGLNVQNLPNNHKSSLRRAFTAPEGQVIVVVDSSQIELRVNAWLAGQQSTLDTLVAGGDVYVNEAANQFGTPTGAVTKQQRNYGKLCCLGLGYGMGATKFRKTAAAGPLGLDPIYISAEEAYSTVRRYRQGNPMIPLLWKELDARIHQIAALRHLDELDGRTGLRFMFQAVELPSGRQLQYFNLSQGEEGQWTYGGDKKTKFIWGGTLAENLCQALARDIVFHQMLEIDKQYRVVSSTHDEVLYLAPENEAGEALQFGIEVFSQSPVWAPGLPLSAEGGYDRRYSK
jgi:DNA polymerase